MQKFLVVLLVILASLALGFYYRTHPNAPNSAVINPLNTPYVTDAEVLRAESEGHLIIDSDVKHYFDYLLTSADSLDVIQVRAETAFGQNLQSEIAKHEANSLWKAYIDYLRMYTKLEIQIKPVDLQENLQLLRERTVGKKETPAFFAEEITLEQKWLNAQSKPEELLKQMPGIGSSIYLLVQNNEVISRFMLEKDAFDAFVSELKTQQNYDRFKNDPVAELNQRYMDYLSVRDKIMNWDLPDTQREALIQDYLGRHFSQHELLKINELDKAHGGMDQ